MHCTEFLQRYTDYDDSLLPSGEEARFRSHLAACPSCARYDRVLRKGRMVARQGSRVEPSPDFIPRLERRLLREPAGVGMAGEGASRLAAALASVTVVLGVSAALTVFAGGAAGHRGTQVVVDVPPASLPARPAWGVERVDRPAPSSYSPVVTGPPAYRRDAPSAILLTTNPTLD